MDNTQILLVSILSGTTTFFLISWLQERSYRKLDRSLYELEKTRVEKCREFVETLTKLNEKKPRKEKKNERKER